MKNIRLIVKVFSMKFLSDLDETDKEIKINYLKCLAKGYNDWIDEDRISNCRNVGSSC